MLTATYVYALSELLRNQSNTINMQPVHLRWVWAQFFVSLKLRNLRLSWKKDPLAGVERMGMRTKQKVRRKMTGEQDFQRKVNGLCHVGLSLTASMEKGWWWGDCFLSATTFWYNDETVPSFWQYRTLLCNSICQYRKIICVVLARALVHLRVYMWFLGLLFSDFVYAPKNRGDHLFATIYITQGHTCIWQKW